jgi:hypothetical protein
LGYEDKFTEIKLHFLGRAMEGRNYAHSFSRDIALYAKRNLEK